MTIQISNTVVALSLRAVLVASQGALIMFWRNIKAPRSSKIITKPRIFMFFIISPLINLAFANGLGKTTYEIACKNCHAPQLAIGLSAPAAFNKKDWAPRFKQAKLKAKANPTQFKSPIDYLLYNVKLGKGLMHHGGLCQEADIPHKNCSDEALIQAIHYMSKY